MIQITAIHLVGGYEHQHIGSVRWRNTDTKVIGQSTRAEMVIFVRQHPRLVVVHHGGRTVEVGVVNASPPYIRTYADGVWTDNLLALPQY